MAWQAGCLPVGEVVWGAAEVHWDDVVGRVWVACASG